MKPFSAIHVGDVYKLPYPYNNTYTVVNKNKEDKMIEVMCSYQHPSLPQTLWKKHTDKLFNFLYSKRAI